MCSYGGQKFGSRFSLRSGFSWRVRRVLFCTPATCNHLLMLHFMLHKLLTQTKRTRIRPADGKTRGRAPGYLEIQIEERDISMCAGRKNRVQEKGGRVYRFVFECKRPGLRATLRVRSIKPTQKTYQPRARWMSRSIATAWQQHLKPAFVSHDWQRLGLLTLFSTRIMLCKVLNLLKWLCKTWANMLAKLDPTHPPGHTESIINSYVGLVCFPGPPEGSVPLFSRETLRMFNS